MPNRDFKKKYENDNELDDSLIVKESQDAIKEMNDMLDRIGKEIYDDVMEIRKTKREKELEDSFNERYEKYLKEILK